MADGLSLLVDSCVWVDSYLGDHPRHDESLAFLSKARECGATLLYGASKLETMFYILSAEMKRIVKADKGDVSEADAHAARAFAWGCIENIRELGTAVGVDTADLWLASKYRSIGGDFEDNVLLAAAKRSNAGFIVTWDRVLCTTPVAKVATPADMLAVLDLP